MPFCTIPPTTKTIGYGLRIMGEQDVPELKLFMAKSKNGDGPARDEIELATRLFPEATILVYRDSRPARKSQPKP